MDITDILAIRILHVVFLAVLAVGLLNLTDSFSVGYRVLFAVSPIVTWTLGMYYERAIILKAGLVDPETLSDLERKQASLLSRD